MSQRKTGTIKLETGINKLELPAGGQCVGFDAVGSLRLIYDAPADVLGLDKVELHVVPSGSVFDPEGHPYQLLGTASPTGSRPVIIYQVWSHM